jgi:excisionase family DNA binding protein
MFETYPDVVSISQVTEMLGLSKSMVYHLLQNNEMRHVRVGKRYVIPKTAIIDFLEKRWYNGGVRMHCDVLFMEGEKL